MFWSTFPRVLITFLYVPPWFSKRFVSISYVPIRSVQTFHDLNKICARIIRSYTFRVNTPAETENLHLKYTFLYVPCRQSRRNAKNSIELIRSHTFRATLPAESKHCPAHLDSLQGPRKCPLGAHKSKTITFHYVLHTFLYVPRQPLFLEGGFLGTFGARCFLLRSRALPRTSASSLVR